MKSKYTRFLAMRQQQPIRGECRYEKANKEMKAFHLHFDYLVGQLGTAQDGSGSTQVMLLNAGFGS